MNNSLYDAYVRLQVVCDRAKHNADEIDRLRAENERLWEALERAGVTIKTADALAEVVGLVISTTDPRVYLQAFDGVRVSHDAYRKSRAALQTKGDGKNE